MINPFKTNEFSIEFDTIKGLCYNFSEDIFFLADSADPDEMLQFAALHLGLQHLPKYLFTGIQYTHE